MTVSYTPTDSYYPFSEHTKESETLDNLKIVSNDNNI